MHPLPRGVCVVVHRTGSLLWEDICTWEKAALQVSWAKILYQYVELSSEANWKLVTISQCYFPLSLIPGSNLVVALWHCPSQIAGCNGICMTAARVCHWWRATASKPNWVGYTCYNSHAIQEIHAAHCNLRSTYHIPSAVNPFLKGWCNPIQNKLYSS